MILPDVNLLVYAFRTDSVDHNSYRNWLLLETASDRTFGISPQVLSAMVRITTNQRIYAQPSPLNEALAFSEALITAPNAVVVTPGPGHWRIFRSLCEVVKATGNLVQDAWLAALAIESGCEWFTDDRDYARFPGLKVRHPLR